MATHPITPSVATVVPAHQLPAAARTVLGSDSNIAQSCPTSPRLASSWHSRGGAPCPFCLAGGRGEMYHSPGDCHVNPCGPSFWRYAYNGMVCTLRQHGLEVPALLRLPMPPASSASVPVTTTMLVTHPVVATASVGPTAPAVAKSVATTSTQAHTCSDPLAALLAMYGKEGVLNLVEERLVAQPPVQAMVKLKAEPDRQCAGLDDVIADLTKMAAVPVPDNIVASPPAKKR